MKSKKLGRGKAKERVVEDLVAGILLNHGRFLVEKRRQDKEVDPGYVELPGGHVENGETLEGALKREMREELGIEVVRAKFVQNGITTATNGERGRIHYFHIEKWSGRIVSNEAERVYWESYISNLSLVPDRKAMLSLLKRDGIV